MNIVNRYKLQLTPKTQWHSLTSEISWSSSTTWTCTSSRPVNQLPLSNQPTTSHLSHLLWGLSIDRSPSNGRLQFRPPASAAGLSLNGASHPIQSTFQSESLNGFTACCLKVPLRSTCPVIKLHTYCRSEADRESFICVKLELSLRSITFDFYGHILDFHPFIQCCCCYCWSHLPLVALITRSLAALLLRLNWIPFLTVEQQHN